MKKLKKLFQNGLVKEFKKNQFIITPYKRSKGIYQITEGFVIVYNQSAFGKRKIQTILKAGDIFLILWVLKHLQKNLYVKALTNVSTRYITKKAFLRGINQEKKAAFEVIDILAAYLNIYVDRLENLEYETLEKKLLSRLIFFASRFGRKNNTKIIIELPLTHQIIAESINVSRENIARELKLLEKENLLSFKKHKLVLFNLAELKKRLK